jgi:hypothetical protein
VKHGADVNCDMPRVEAIATIIYQTLACSDYAQLAAWLLEQGCTDDEAIAAVKATNRWKAIRMVARMEPTP